MGHVLPGKELGDLPGGRPGGETEIDRLAVDDGGFRLGDPCPLALAFADDELLGVCVSPFRSFGGALREFPVARFLGFIGSREEPSKSTNRPVHAVTAGERSRLRDGHCDDNQGPERLVRTESLPFRRFHPISDYAGHGDVESVNLAAWKVSGMQILVTDPIAEAGLDRLREAGHEVVTDYELDGEALREAIEGVHALIVRSGTDVTREVLDAADELVIVGRAGIGVDNIDIDAATEHGVIVANAPEGNVRAAAEHTVAMTFAAARSIPQAHTRLKAGEWAKGDYLGTEVNGKTLGIVGLGRVGQEVAKRLRSLGMDLVAYDPYISEERAEQIGAELVEFEDCLDRADFLTVHTPLTPETEDLISHEELAQLEGGYLINCARGGVIDEAALAEAVAEGTLAGAGIDVFAEEPISPDNPLLNVENVIVTPHLGASTEAAQENVATSTAEQVLAAFEGEPVLNALNAPSIEESAFPRVRPYIELGETAGRIATQLLDGRIESVDVRYEGEIADEEVDLVTASALKGVFSSLEWQVNAVNAPQIAEDRGVDVTETTTHQSENFQSVITVTVGDGEDSVDVSGTLFAGDDPRIVRIDGYRVDAVPHGHMLIARNYDEPGVIGLVGTVLGEEGINIAGMYNAREAIGGEALTVYDLDEPVPDDVIDELEADDTIIEARYITLNGADTVPASL